jgi:hypothetical protein
MAWNRWSKHSRIIGNDRRRRALLKISASGFEDGLTVDRCSEILVKKMALAAEEVMRIGMRGAPSWPGICPETGYVGADCLDIYQNTCRRGEPYVFKRLGGIGILRIMPRAGGEFAIAQCAHFAAQGLHAYRDTELLP